MSYDQDLEIKREMQEKGYRTEINSLISQYASSIVQRCVRKGMTNKKKAKAIAKGLARTLSYTDYDNNDIEGSTLRLLENHRSYCHIYALIYEVACRQAGIPCRVAAGYSYRTTKHAWNRIKPGRKWFFVDVVFMIRAGTEVPEKHIWLLKSCGSRIG